MDNSKKQKEQNTAEQDYSHRCLTCQHWSGDKVKQWRDIKEYGHVCMSAWRGWPCQGQCGCFHKWGENPIDGDATAEVLIQANHGCRLWVPVEEDD